MPDVGTTFDQIGGAVRTALTLTRHGRLRSQIRDSLDLRDKALAQAGLEGAVADLTEVITFQTGELKTVVTSPSAALKPQWGVFAVTVFFMIVCAVIAYVAGVRFLPTWWAALLASVFFLGTAFFFILSIAAVFYRR